MPDPLNPNPDPGANPAAPPTNPPPAPDPGAAPAGGNILADSLPQIPEKFLVKKQDGTPDWEGISKKAIAGFTWAEKKIGAGEIPPEKETDYKLDYAKFGEDKINPDREKSFLKYMHGHGFTNKQAQAVIDKFGELINEGKTFQKDSIEKTYQDVATELRTLWGDAAESNITAIKAGFQALADAEDIAGKDQIGKDLKTTYKAYLKMLAKVGADYIEDKAPQGQAFGSEGEIEALQKSEAYWDPKHPQHNIVKQKVSAYYTAKFADKK